MKGWDGENKAIVAASWETERVLFDRKPFGPKRILG